MAKGFNKTPEIIKELRKWSGIKGKIGILGDGELATIGAVQEFGATIKVTDAMRGYLASQGLFLRKETNSIEIPERSYIRSTLDDRNTGEAMGKSAKDADSLDGKQIMSVMCATAVGRIQKKMNSGVGPGLSDFTKEQKGSGLSLVDTGRLRNSISYEVVG
ncbi:MAG: hypothetical protein CMF59_16620 [Leptospiraceae bacterium]|nr:hypothetical protein [Leptospiraceae bacterium]